jgi:glutamate N-acetyltransferase/amino-acid N-acetyltransferase
MAPCVPQGFRVAGVHCGIKRNPAKEDFTLVVADRPAVAAGVYTQNRVFAAPVAFDRQRTPGADFRVVAVNSGNANACTGERGLRDAGEMARLAAQACGANERQALVMSTGIIGEFLPMQKIAAGIEAARSKLAADEAALVAAARGIMTTDRYHKLAGGAVQLGGRTMHITGMAKGAGMIGPNMATMLGLVLTDAPLSPNEAQSTLAAVADETFNCISVEGHTSTNDTLLLLASGAVGGAPLAGVELERFRAALREVCTDLARLIPADGEGSSHLVTVEIRGLATRADALQIAKTVANSALVKTAVAGNDPNWGRIVSAAGYAGVPFDAERVDLTVNGIELYRQGVPVAFDAAAASASIRDNHETHIVLTFAEGPEAVRFWTSDLTAEYVRINADYHT